MNSWGKDVTEAGRLAVGAALRQLDLDPGEVDFPITRLAGGLSGSAVWRFVLGGRPVVLKVTAPDAIQVLERAERECRFYQDLADRVPVHVPQMIGQSLGSGEVAVLLLAAYPPAPPLREWSLADYQQVAHDLGLLHGTFWSASGADLPGWLRSPAEISSAAAAEASALWADVEVADDLLPLRVAAERLAVQVPWFDRERERLPLTLCHGDAHRDNLLRGETGGWIWADWQEVRLGFGVDDLAFFWQRAFTVTDTLPPMETMLATYAEGLQEADVPVVSEDVLREAVAWSELTSWLIAWPPYLGWLEPEVRGRVLLRIDALIRHQSLDVM